jgi:hypothetical protein
LKLLISEAFAGYLQSYVLSYAAFRAAVQVALHADLHSQQSCILSTCAGTLEQLCRYLRAMLHPKQLCCHAELLAQLLRVTCTAAQDAALQALQVCMRSYLHSCSACSIAQSCLHAASRAAVPAVAACTYVWMQPCRKYAEPAELCT